MSGGDRRPLGRWGEDRVADWLRERGWLVIGSNWRCRFGEIDLIAINDKYIIFTEVKLRKDAGFAPARAFVDGKKQKRLRISAQLYLLEHPTQLQPRFDVAEVYAPYGVSTGHPVICYIEDAF